MRSLAIMVAPNGARKGKADHPGIPMTTGEIEAEVAALDRAGVDAVHLHVRDNAGLHALDAARYREASEAVRRRIGPDLILQATTEAVGRFTPAEQIGLVRALKPEAVSIATVELIPEPSAESAARDLYHWAYGEGIAVQHILYSTGELDRALGLIDKGIIPGKRHSLLFPLGRYAGDQESEPKEMLPFLAKLAASGRSEAVDWWICAFGKAETASLVAAAALGGHCRIGFENSFFNSDGTRAASNAERVADLRRGLAAISRPRPSRAETLFALGKPAT